MNNNNRIALSQDTLLLLVMSMPHLWFNPASNALMVIALAVYVGLDLLFRDGDEAVGLPERRGRILFMVRLAIVFFIVLMAVVLPAGLNIIQRLDEGPAFYAHDGLIQTEEAVKFILDGKNPYREDYVDTPMADFPGREPPITDLPLYHNPYLPFLFLSAIPFYLLSQATLGWYDQRLVFLLAYFVTLLLLAELVKERRRKLGLMIAFGLNFLFAFYAADGRNDVMVILGLVLVTFLLSRRHLAASAVVLGLTMMLKHSAWFFLPFYLFYLWDGRFSRASLVAVVRRTWPLAVALAAVLIPFLFWDAPALLDDTVFHVVGSGDETLPIRGWGFSTLLLVVGIVPTPYSPFPFSLFGLLFGLPTLFWVLRKQQRHNTLQMVWFGFAIFSFMLQFFSRFFNDNYFVFILQALVIAYFIRSQSFHPQES